MAADPNAAAQELAGRTYASAQERTAAGKKALLDNLAANGTYQNTIDQGAVQMAGQSVQPNTQGGAMQSIANRGTDQVNAMGQAAAAAAAALAAQNHLSQQEAAKTYFDQVSAAVPIEQSRAQSQAAQIMQELIDQREARANAIKLQQLQMEETRARIAAAAADRAAAERAAAQQLSPTQMIAAQQAAYMGVLTPYQYTNPKTLKPELNRRGKAIDYVVNHPGVSVEEAGRKFGLNQTTSYDEIANAVAAYNSQLAGYGMPGVPIVRAPSNPNVNRNMNFDAGR